jgi:hypothetical protein
MHTPTQEQQACIEAFLTGDSMKVNAFAGSGKTSTLKMMAREKISPGMYLCFNKAIALESAKSFPETVDCKTTHSCAYRAVIGTYQKNRDKMINSLRVRDTVDALRIRPFPIFGATDSLDATTLAYAVNLTVRRFCQSADTEFQKHHFEKLPKFETLPTDEFLVLRGRVLSWASDLWQMAVDPRTNVALGHDGYVKVWQLGNPVIDTCYIMVDEAQDTNPVMLDVLRRQETQVIYVGDRHQQIYEWRGAVNAMEIATTKHTVNLTKSFRFGQDIADTASAILATIGETCRIEGNEGIESRLTRESQRTILCRTNGQILDTLLSLTEQGLARDTYVVGGVDELVNCLEGVERLKDKRASAYGMFIGFKDWDEFLLYTKKSGDADAEKIVKLTDKYEVSDLKDTLRSVLPSEAKAKFTLTTGHKSKGREWSGVELAEDFRSQPEKDEDTGEEKYSESETRLFYVSATRAINRLKLPNWAMVTYDLKVKDNADAPALPASTATNDTPF